MNILSGSVSELLIINMVIKVKWEKVWNLFVVLIVTAIEQPSTINFNT